MGTAEANDCEIWTLQCFWAAHSKVTTAYPALTSLYLLTECSEGSPDLEALELLHQCQPWLQDRKPKNTSLNDCDYNQTYKTTSSGPEWPLFIDDKCSLWGSKQLCMLGGGDLPSPVPKKCSSTPGIACTIILHGWWRQGMSEGRETFLLAWNQPKISVSKVCVGTID